MVRAMTERVQADTHALSELAGRIGLLREHIADGVRHLSDLLDEMDWEDDNYYTYRQVFDEATPDLLVACELLCEQEAALLRLMQATETLVYDAVGGTGGGADGSSNGQAVHPHAVEYDLSQFDGVGDPQGAARFWQRQTGNSCAIMAQICVLEYLTGRRIGEDEACAWLEEQGWYDPYGGTSRANSARVLELTGVPYEVCDGADFETLVECLEQGEQVVVGFNAEEVWNPLRDSHGRVVPQPDGGGHAVWITGVDVDDNGSVVVLMNDTGHPEGAARPVALEDFLMAWDHFGNFMVIARRKPQG